MKNNTLCSWCGEMYDGNEETHIHKPTPSIITLKIIKKSDNQDGNKD